MEGSLRGQDGHCTREGSGVRCPAGPVSPLCSRRGLPEAQCWRTSSRASPDAASLGLGFPP